MKFWCCFIVLLSHFYLAVTFLPNQSQHWLDLNSQSEWFN